MKYIYISALALLSYCFCWKAFGWGHFDKSFHVTVECYYENYYCIYYNQHDFPFDHAGNLMTTFDISSNEVVDSWLDYIMFSPNDVVHQLYLGNREKCIEIGSGMRTYGDVLKWNNVVNDRYESLLAFRKKHPFHITLKKKCEDCCQPVEIR